MKWWAELKDRTLVYNTIRGGIFGAVVLHPVMMAVTTIMHLHPEGKNIHFHEIIGREITATLYASYAAPMMPWIITFTLIGASMGAYYGRIINGLDKRVQEQTTDIRKSEACTRSIIDTSTDAIILADSKGAIADFNKGAESIFGYKKEEVIGEQLTLLMPERYRSAHTHSMREANHRGKPKYIGRTHELHGLRKDGSEFPLELNVALWKINGEGYSSGIIRDITERKKVQAALQANEYFLKESQKAGGIGSYFTDFTVGQWKSSEVLDNIFGIDDNYDRSVDGWLQIVHPEDRERMSTYLNEHVIAKQQPFDMEYRIIRVNDKTERWVHGHGAVEFDEKGNILTMVGTIQDITERKKAKEMLEESEKKYRTLVDNSLVGVFRTNLKGDILFINRAMADLLDFESTDELMAQGVLKSYKDPEERKRLIRVLKKSGKVENFEITVLTRKGEERNMVLNSVLEGETISGTMMDITQQKKAEEELKKSLEELTVVHKLDRAIVRKQGLKSILRFLVTTAKKLTEADASFFGYLDEDDVIRHHSFIGIKTKEFKDIELKKGEGLGWLALRKKEPIIIEDFFSDKRLKNAPYDAVKNEGLISFIAVPFISASNKPIGVLYVAKRKKTSFNKEHIRPLLTLAGQAGVAVEHAKLVDELQKAFAELKDLDRLKSDIISNVSHELRTPLTIMTTSLELMESEDNPENLSTLINLARNAAIRQNQVVEDLITVSTIRKDKLTLDFEPVDVSALILNVRKSLEPIAQERKISLQHTSDTRLPKVRADPDKLAQIIRNLAHNAVKFSKDGGIVEITAEQSGKKVRICVTDQGIGMTKADMKRIFKPLYQIDSSTKRQYEGTGMGLSVVDELVKLHGAELEVESKEGVGSSFCIILEVW